MIDKLKKKFRLWAAKRKLKRLENKEISVLMVVGKDPIHKIRPFLKETWRQHSVELKKMKRLIKIIES